MYIFFYKKKDFASQFRKLNYIVSLEPSEIIQKYSDFYKPKRHELIALTLTKCLSLILLFIIYYSLYKLYNDNQ